LLVHKFFIACLIHLCSFFGLQCYLFLTCHVLLQNLGFPVEALQWFFMF
jgi:hypothetical protein